MTFPEFFYYVKQPPIWQTLPESARREIRRAVKADIRGNLGEARLKALIEKYAMIQIEQYKKYSARIRYHRTDDMQPDALPNGTELIVRALWIADPDEKFAWDWIFEPIDRGYWLPERDLQILGPA